MADPDPLRDNPWAEGPDRDASDAVAIVHAVMAVAYEIARHRLVMERFHATANHIRTQMEVERRTHK